MAKINYREFGFTEDFAGINFRELSLTKDCPVINHRESDLFKDLAGVNLTFVLTLFYEGEAIAPILRGGDLSP